MEQALGQTKWMVPFHANLALRQWHDECVVHHALSNDTYRLSLIAAEMVEYLLSTGVQPESYLCQHFSLESGELHDMLQELSRLNIVESL